MLKNTDKYYFHKLTRTSGSHASQHYHGLWEIYYMVMGKCNYFIGERIFEVEPGDLVIIPPGTIHKTNYSSEFHSRLLINFSDEYLLGKVAASLREVGYIYRNPETKREIEGIFERIEGEYAKADSYSEEALTLYTTALALLAVRNKKEGENFTTVGSLIDGAVKYVRDNYMNDIKLSGVATELSVSPEHLSRLFKRVTGFGFSEYLTILRLKAAEEMLKREPGVSVSEVAYACGFNDSNYFSYKFKKVYGIAPTKARSGGE